MKKQFKGFYVTSALILSLGSTFAIADDNDNSSGDRDKAKNGAVSDKPDAYTVEDSKENGLTNAKKPVRKLHHKQKTKSDKPADTSSSSDASSGAGTTN